MYFIYNGVKQNVYEAIDVLKDEFVYIVECDECGEQSVFTEYDFIEMVEDGKIDVICEDEDEDDDACCDGDCANCPENEEEDEDFDFDEDEILCDCPECQTERMSEQSDEFIESLLDGDILTEIYELKESMVFLRAEGLYDEYLKVVQAYEILFKLITK